MRLGARRVRPICGFGERVVDLYIKIPVVVLDGGMPNKVIKRPSLPLQRLLPDFAAQLRQTDNTHFHILTSPAVLQILLL